MESVNEKTTLIAVLTFKDEDELPVVPNSFTYQIDDVDSGTQIKAPTTIVPSDSTYDLEILYSDNRILDQTKAVELRRITIEYVYGATSKQGHDEFLYVVRNLNKVT